MLFKLLSMHLFVTAKLFTSNFKYSRRRLFRRYIMLAVQVDCSSPAIMFQLFPFVKQTSLIVVLMQVEPHPQLFTIFVPQKPNLLFFEFVRLLHLLFVSKLLSILFLAQSERFRRQLVFFTTQQFMLSLLM